MKKYKVAFTWMESVVVKVDASSLEEAKKMFYQDKIAIPERGDYVDDSLRIDEQFTIELNEQIADL